MLFYFDFIIFLGGPVGKVLLRRLHFLLGEYNIDNRRITEPVHTLRYFSKTSLHE